MTRMPAVFIGHGSPMNTLEANVWTDAWQALAAALPVPRAVLSVSAHWYIDASAVTAMPSPATIHDFGGFPDELFRYQYPAPGEPRLAKEVADLFPDGRVVLDEDQWGLDHGTWSVLAHLFPRADVPVVQLSIDRHLHAQDHLELGRLLAPLRDDDVLVLGSGNVVHNLQRVRWQELTRRVPPGPPYDWAERSGTLVRAAIEAGDDDALVAFPTSEDGRMSHPSPDHYLPLLYVEGTRHPDDEVTIVVDGYEAGALSMLSVRLG
jgi:4,5-DOPA dioxygenase extradiol